MSWSQTPDEEVFCAPALDFGFRYQRVDRRTNRERWPIRGAEPGRPKMGAPQVAVLTLAAASARGSGPLSSTPSRPSGQFSRAHQG